MSPEPFYLNFHDPFSDFDDHCLPIFYRRKSQFVHNFLAHIAAKLHTLFISNADPKSFCYMFETFAPLEDYGPTCLKLINKNYL